MTGPEDEAGPGDEAPPDDESAPDARLFVNSNDAFRVGSMLSIAAQLAGLLALTVTGAGTLLG